MSARLYALGFAAFRARGRVLLAWVGILVVVLGAAATLGVGTNNTYSFPGTESQDALDSLGRTFPQFSGTSAQLVAVAPKGSDVTGSQFKGAVDDAVTALAKIPQVASVTSPYGSTSSGDIAPDRSAVLVPIQMTVSTVEVLPSSADALQEEGRRLLAALPSGSRVAVGGQLFAQVNPGIGPSEVSGLAIALVVLLFTFGALVAAGMPLVTAVVGVGTAVGIVLTGTRFTTVTSTAPLLAVMIGLAVGVDYAVFIIARHQDQLRRGMDPHESAARAVATAGSAVAFAAMTVIIALLGLTVARIPFLTVTGVSSALGVASAALVALTLTPALLGFAGWRMVRRRDRPGARQAAVDGSEETSEPEVAETPESDPGADVAPVGDEAHERAADHAARSGDAGSAQGPGTHQPAEGDQGGTPDPAAPGTREDATDEGAPGDEAATSAPPGGFFGHWVRAATRWPPVTVVLVTGVLALTALPATALRLALPDAGALPAGAPGRVTYDLVAEHFGPGYNGPLIVTGSVIRSTDPVTLVDDIADEIRTIRGVDLVPLATPNESGDTAVIQVIPTGAPDSAETEDLVQALRARHQHFLDDYGVDLSVTGYTALGVDISTRLGGAVLPFGLLVIGLSLVLLAMVFRSLVVPLTAALGYALSIGAAFGITALVFMDGVAAGPLNVLHVGSVTSFMPIILMGVLFGLAMDYEVFLVSRMREHYVHHGEPRPAIHQGFVASARVVTAAAIIMTAVFAGFIRNGEASIQPIAVGLAAGVAIDAFVVRMTLIPAVLALFGRFAWWFPAWLDRALPHFDVEGEGLSREEELAEWPEPGDRIAVAAEGLQVAAPSGTVPPLDLHVPAGDVLLVEGGSRADRTALVLALTGRVAVTGGRCKVAGLVLPPRAATVRSRTAVVRLDRAAAPTHALLDALLDDDVDLVAVDGADTLADPDVRHEVHDVLDEASRGAATHTGRALTLVLTAAAREWVLDLVPEGSAVHVVSLDEATAAVPEPAGGR